MIASLSLGIGEARLAPRRSGWSLTAGPTLTTDEVAGRSERSIGFVAGAGNSGTGVLIGDGLLATNAHVTESIPPDCGDCPARPR